MFASTGVSRLLETRGWVAPADLLRCDTDASAPLVEFDILQPPIRDLWVIESARWTLPRKGSDGCGRFSRHPNPQSFRVRFARRVADDPPIVGSAETAPDPGTFHLTVIGDTAVAALNDAMIRQAHLTGLLSALHLPVVGDAVVATGSDSVLGQALRGRSRGRPARVFPPRRIPANDLPVLRGANTLRCLGASDLAVIRDAAVAARCLAIVTLALRSLCPGDKRN